MDRRLAAALTLAFFGLLLLFTGQIVADSVQRYFTHAQAPPSPIVANAFAHPYLVLHVASSIVALVIAPLQFVRQIRERIPAVHRATGRIYVGATAVAAPTGFVLAIGTTAGPLAGIGFATQAVLWAIFTGLGVRAAMTGRFADHRAWMLRSYAMTAGAVTLRLMLPASAWLGIGFFTAYPVIAWLGLITNLALVEYYLRRTGRSEAGFAKLATA